MTDADRIARLEAMVSKLSDALIRKGSEQDGNWGCPKFNDEMREIKTKLKEPDQ